MKTSFSAFLLLIVACCMHANAFVFSDNQSSALSNPQLLTFKERLTLKERQWLEANPHIEITTDQNWYPFVFINQQGEVDGFNKDLIALINHNLGTKFTLKRERSWATAYDKLVDGKIWALTSVTPTEARKQLLSFSPVYYFTAQHILTRNNRDDIETLADLSGKRIAIFKNHIIGDYIKQQVAPSKIHYIESTLEGLESVASGQVDAAVITHANGRKVKEMGLKIAAALINDTGNLAIATHKSQPLLTEILSKGVASISKQQLADLTKKWFNMAKDNRLFTDEELDYIKRNPVLNVGVDEWKPYLFSNQQHAINGIVGDILADVAKTSGFSFQAVTGHKQQLEQQFKQGVIDIMPATFSASLSNHDNASVDYLSLTSSLFIDETRHDISGLSDLVGKKLVVIQGSRHHELIESLQRGISVIKVDNYAKALELINTNGADALWGDSYSVSQFIESNFIHGIRALPLHSDVAQQLVMRIQNDQPLLKSILSKSLMLISQSRKKIITNDWLSAKHHKTGLNLAFGLGKEPFTLDHPKIRGIEYDLMYRALRNQGMEIYSAVNLSTPLLHQALASNSNIDAKVAVNPKDDGYFYSRPFINFDNVVISRAKDNRKITAASDLAGLTTLAFTDAYKYLGDDYYALFNPQTRPKDYREYKFQQQQVASFLRGEGDVLVIDKNIFEWQVNHTPSHEVNDFTYHTPFSQKNATMVGFRDKYIRDRFNQGLLNIRNSGEYDYIIKQYTNNVMQYKIEAAQLFSAIIANHMYSTDTTPLKNLLNSLISLPYIERVDVFDNQQNLIEQATVKSSNNKYFNQQDIINIFDKVASPQGYLNIYFDDNYIANHLKGTSLIPDIQHFKSQPRFSYISAIYHRLNYQNNELAYTNQEQRYLDSHPVIRFSEVDWRPLSIIENGKFTGLMADYLDIISAKTGIEFALIKASSWPGVIQAFEQQRIDLIPGITDIEQNAASGLISEEFSFFHFGIVMDENASFVDTLSDLQGKTIALPKGDPVFYFIKKQYPDANIIETSSMEKALALVENQKADAYIGHMAVAIYQLETRYRRLKIVGQLDAGFSHRIMVHDDQQILLSVINKVLASIDDATHREIRQRWVQRNVSTAVDYEIIYWIIFCFSIISIVFVVSFRRVKAAQRQVSRSHKELSKSMAALNEQKEIFETLFYDTSDGLLLMKDGIYTDCNNAALKMLRMSDKQQIIGLTPVDISPTKQPDGQLSAQQREEIDQRCASDGTERFEWVFQKLDGQQFWVEIVLTEIVRNNENTVHVVWRDISDKKTLEQAQISHNAQLIDANRDLEKSLKDLKDAQQQLIESEKMASLGGLVAGVAHEINTPVGIGLTAATHFLELNQSIEEKYVAQKMKKSDFDSYLGASKEIAELLMRNLERTAELVRSFKQVSVDQSSSQSRVFNIAEYIEEILTSIHHVIKHTQIIIEVECEPTLSINGCPGTFSQIISNLVLNASIHAFPDKQGVITIKANEQGEHLNLMVMDDGIGIEQENLSKIFEPFYTTNRDNGGSGLGLNIVYNIVTNQLNGSINCASELGQGTVFSISFPVELA